MQITDTIHIDASPELVWAVTEDVERWPEWTPTVTSVKLVSNPPIGPGSIARLKQPMQQEAEWIVTDFVPGRRFAWQTTRKGMQMTGIHEISPDGCGTRNVLRVEASGIFALLFWPMLRPVMRKSIADENRGLKARCEQVSSASSAG